MKNSSITNKLGKPVNNYTCTICMYLTHKKCDYEKHCLTSKHCNKLSMCPLPIFKPIVKNTTDTNNNKEIYICDKCSKQYKHKQSLYRHKCKLGNTDKTIFLKLLQEKNTVEKKNQSLSNSINALLEQTKANTEICNTLTELVRDNNNTNTVVNNTINNNKFNINVFLNTECKDAMNITEFIEHLNLSIEDLIYTRNNGFAKGITNIFVKNLEGLEPTTRPIHCSDANNMQFYIKDKDKWEHDPGHSALNTTIDSVSKKQVLQIKEWEKQNPTWSDTDEGTAEYLLTVQSLMGGINDMDRERNKEIIKSNIVDKVEFPKDNN